ncbi:MAG: hypothetical protein DI601_17410 [Azospirillum brasilense]|nr:MAG: hypothetical protein DI601_17410 [Azospirillum brasilense]
MLGDRIADRGRENEVQAIARLARRVPSLDGQVEMVRIVNDSTIEEGVDRPIAALEGAAARMVLRRVPIDSGRVGIAYLPADSRVVPASGFLGTGRASTWTRRRCGGW